MIRKQKPYIVAMNIFYHLPDSIKDAAGSIETMQTIARLLKEAGIEDEARRLVLGDIVYSMFIGELPPHLLVDAIKEELHLEDTKAQLIGAFIKKSFVESNIDFLTRAYQNTPKQNPAQNPNSVPPGNVVNLKRSE